MKDAARKCSGSSVVCCAGRVGVDGRIWYSSIKLVAGKSRNRIRHVNTANAQQSYLSICTKESTIGEK